MRCVDYTSSFTAYSGAPKQDMYRDPLHPSAKGTGRLACNIKYADRPRQRPALLKPPGPMQPGQFQNRQQGANAWQSVPGRLSSMTTPPSQQRGYTNVQRQPYCLMDSSCPPHHHLPADNGYPPPPYYPYGIPLVGVCIGPQLSPYTTLFPPFIANTSPTCMQLKHSYNGSKQQCVFVYMRVCAARGICVCTF